MKLSGFTIIELLVVLTIVSVLGAIAYPNYQDFMREAKRSEAHKALNTIQGQLGRYMLENNLSDISSSDLSNITIAATTTNGLYSIAVDASGQGYSITATATGKQARDTNCATLILTHDGVETSTNSNSNASTGCW